MLNSLGDLDVYSMIRTLLYGNTEHSEQVNTKAFRFYSNLFGWD